MHFPFLQACQVSIFNRVRPVLRFSCTSVFFVASVFVHSIRVCFIIFHKFCGFSSVYVLLVCVSCALVVMQHVGIALNFPPSSLHSGLHFSTWPFLPRALRSNIDFVAPSLTIPESDARPFEGSFGLQTPGKSLREASVRRATSSRWCAVAAPLRKSFSCVLVQYFYFSSINVKVFYK